MNTRLVETLAQIIETLPKDERTLLEERLKKPDWATIQKRIEERAANIAVHLGGKPLDLPPEEIIHQMREERTEELMRSGFPQLYSEEAK